jgi:hypothetical protein
MRVICIDNKGAESSLVVGKVYYVKTESIYGKYFYYYRVIRDDNNREDWYPKNLFETDTELLNNFVMLRYSL